MNSAVYALCACLFLGGCGQRKPFLSDVPLHQSHNESGDRGEKVVPRNSQVGQMQKTRGGLYGVEVDQNMLNQQLINQTGHSPSN